MTALGIDIGTTSVKVVLLDSSGEKCLFKASKAHGATVADLPVDHHEQDVSKFFSALNLCMQQLQELQEGNMSSVRRIAVSGQMCGVVQWSSGLIAHLTSCQNIEIGPEHSADISSLVTWMDKRADKSFIDSLPTPNSHLSVYPGYGCVTLIHKLNSRLLREGQFDCCGTVADLLVAILCGLVKPVTSDQMAASWGYFNTLANTWNEKILRSLDFPVEVLPKPVRAGTVVGELVHSWFGMPRSAAVLASIGDFQAGIFPHFSENSAVISIGTSAQICCSNIPEDPPPQKPDRFNPVQYYPYFGGRHVCVGASLNGGNVLAAFALLLKSWYSTLGEQQITEEELWTKIGTLLTEAAVKQGGVKSGANVLIRPTVFGERHAPDRLGCVMDISGSNMCDLGAVLYQIVKSLVTNLNEMLPKQILEKQGVKKILLNGEASKPWFVSAVKEMYSDCNFLIEVSNLEVDSAYAAALIASRG